jgi:hypothetical protein
MDQSLFLISMIRNEADILGDFLSHGAALFDHLVLIDHLSVDNSSELMLEAAQMGIPVSRFVFPYRGYYQGEISDAACTWAFMRGADWVFFLDADEFIDVESRDHLVDLLENSTSGLTSFAWKNCVPSKYGTFDRFDLRSGFWKPNSVSRHAKIAIHRELALQASLRIELGNHEVFIGHRSLESERIGTLLHFPV